MAVDIHRKGDLYNSVWIALPAALGTLVMTIQSMVDMFWIGKLGTDAVAAVAIGGNVTTALFGVSSVIYTGTVALMARAIGANDAADASRTMTASLALGGGIGLILLLVGIPLSGAIVSYFGASAEVSRMGVVYLQAMVGHLALLCILIALHAAFSAAGDTITPFFIHSAAVLANSVLDPIFIFGPGEDVALGPWVFQPGWLGWGVFGAGMATVAAVAMAVILYFLMLPLDRFPARLVWPGRETVSPQRLWSIVKIGFPSAAGMLSRPLSTVLLMRIITDFGSGPIAGFGIAMRWYSVNWVLLSGFAAAASILVGQYLGADSKAGAARISRNLILTSLAIQAVSTAGYLYYATRLIAVMDPNPATVGPGADFMTWVVLGFIVSSPGAMAAAAMNGAGDTVPGMVAGVIGNWLIKLPLAWWLSSIPSLGLNGVWYAMFISLIAEGGINLAWYWLGAWQDKDPSAGERQTG